MEAVASGSQLNTDICFSDGKLVYRLSASGDLRPDNDCHLSGEGRLGYYCHFSLVLEESIMNISNLVFGFWELLERG